MFSFNLCDSITVRDLELNGNIDAAILGGRIFFDGMQTAYDGVNLSESGECEIKNVHAHHFGRDGLLLYGRTWSGYPLYMVAHPYLNLEEDLADASFVDTNRTVLFNNRVLNSSFNWNGRQGISWTALSGLSVSNCNMNYNGAGRFASSPGAGLEIEGIGGPLRVRYGIFDGSRFLHNAGFGIISDNGQCIGQQDFRFNDCVVKAGEDADALLPNTKGMKFTDCQIYGRVVHLFEQAENLPNDTSTHLLFRRTEFREEDDQWSYLFVDTTTWSTTCVNGPTKLDLVAPNNQAACVTFDSCGFYTNCRGMVRLLGRQILDTNYPYCDLCVHCNDSLASTCATDSCGPIGPYHGAPNPQLDARYMRATNCTFKNTGRLRCNSATTLIKVDLTTLDNFTIDVPDSVRDPLSLNDYYDTRFGLTSWATPSCSTTFCSDVDTTYTPYEFFPPCRPFYTWPIVDHWAFCDPATGNVMQPLCGNYILTKTATPGVAYIDSSVTFTITVCNNTAVAGPVQLTEVLPPFFEVTSANPAWDFVDTTITLNNGECAVFEITGYFTEFGDYTNTVNLDPDSMVTGDELSADADVSVVSTCAAAIVIPDSSLASVVGTVFSGTVNIQGLFIVDDDVTFQSAEVFMEPGAEIVVQEGWFLDIQGSSFTACNGVMWKSITAENGSFVRIRGSFMDDAESTIAALDGSVVWVDNTQFHNNRVALGIPENGLPYNDVACWVSNCEFYSQGLMPLPYAGQTTAVGTKGYAAVDAHNTLLDFTGGNNIIHTLSNGIVAHNCDVSVTDCRILQIQPDTVYDYVGNGAGIYAFGGNGYYTLKQQGFGVDSAPSFEDCRWGVYTEYMSVRSSNNNMLDMGTAYRVDRSGLRDVDILDNRVHAHYHGMDLRFNDGAAHILIEGNDITFGDDQVCTICRGYSAIRVFEGNTGNLNSVIHNNTIHFVPLTSSRFGISLNSAADWLVAGNTLQMADNGHNLTGIQLNGCKRPEVSCNNVKGDNNGFPEDAQAAIRNMMGSDVLISCNDVDSTANGIMFNFVTPNTEVRGNHFHNHKWPLHLDGTAVIGEQDRRGNLWDPNAATPVLGAWYEDSLNAFANPFYYYPETISGGNTAPPSVWPTFGWFNFSLGSNYDCSDDEGEDYCSQFNERGKERLTDLDVRVAEDSLENDPYTEETKWMLKGRLFKKLDENPEFVDSLEVMADLYDELQSSSTAAFKEIDDGQLALYVMDSIIVIQLKQNRTQIDSLMIMLSEGMEQIGDSTLTTAQRAAIIAGLSGYRESIRDLSAWNAMALQVASISKELTADEINATNASVTTSELIEANEKSVNSIYLATIGKDADEFTAYQASELFDIASQCPMLGGNVVFKARSLYWLIDDAQDFDDALLCLPYGIVVKRLTVSEPNGVTVVPNPATDEATLMLMKQLDGPGVFLVFDAFGAEVICYQIPAEASRLAFSTVSLAPALYHYSVRGLSGIIGNGKLMIVR